MERTHTPLSVWFWAAYLVGSQTPGVSATQFQRQVGLSRYETAFQILHKLRAGMVDRIKIGSAAEPAITSKSMKPGSAVARVARAGAFTTSFLSLAPSKCGLAKRGYKHLAVAERGDPQVVEEYLPIIHLVFSNLKTWLSGIHHGVSDQHLQAYLNEFTFRFNRRFYPFNAFRSLLGIAGDVKAPTYAELYSGDWGHPKCSGCG